MVARLLVNNDIYELNEASGRGFRDTFFEHQVVTFPDFLTQGAFALLYAEVQRIQQIKIRRNFLMPGSENTPRRMSTIGGLDVAQMSSLIPMLYTDSDLLAFLSGVAGEQVFPVDDPVENHVLNFLHEIGDIHGGHVDTYPYAFNVMIEAPPRSAGGQLEMVKDSTVIKDLDDTSKVNRMYIPANTCYLLRTDKAVHRVSPLVSEGRRTVVNMAYANRDTLNEVSYSSSALYGPPDSNVTSL